MHFKFSSPKKKLGTTSDLGRQGLGRKDELPMGEWRVLDKLDVILRSKNIVHRNLMQVVRP